MLTPSLSRLLTRHESRLFTAEVIDLHDNATYACNRFHNHAPGACFTASFDHPGMFTRGNFQAGENSGPPRADVEPNVLYNYTVTLSPVKTASPQTQGGVKPVPMTTTAAQGGVKPIVAEAIPESLKADFQGGVKS